ncbi:MAG: ATP-binding cassette domain-containing protein [Pirellulales bacterium]|nr:ATP-binding cassette domain-containing protein [Pirellulales bacterium]
MIESFVVDTRQSTTVAPSPPLLRVCQASVRFPTEKTWFGATSGYLQAVAGVSLELRAGETLGLVGESGCGKSTLSRAIAGLTPLHGGEVYYKDERIDDLNDHARQAYRRKMQLVFQDPFASLNPRQTVAQIITEPMTIFGLHPPRERLLQALRLLELVGLNPRSLNRYPHEFSGGQRQRIGIARALAAEPEVLILDEPVSALDVSIQAQVINLLEDLQRQLGLAYLFIAHDLSVIRHLSDRVAVMYLGRVVETAPVEELFAQPRHPYTQALLAAIPVPDPIVARLRRRQRPPVGGELPSEGNRPSGCAFAERCPLADLECLKSVPPLVGEKHATACFKVAGEDGLSLERAAIEFPAR